MYKISLMNVGSDMVTKSFVTTVDTLAEAEILAMAEAKTCSGVTGVAIFRQTGIEYVIEKDNIYVGSVVITGK